MVQLKVRSSFFRRILLISSTLNQVVQLCHGAGVGNFFTYYESGGLGPSRWAFLELGDDHKNQCGGTGGTSGYGQSPVTISAETQDRACDTNMNGYKFFPGTCTWDDLVFSISNNGVKVQPKENTDCSFGQMNIPQSSNKFDALQFHIHTFSEHQIVGKGIGGSGFFPAEVHVVHQETTKDSFAVLGSMISVSQTNESHELFEWFLRGWEAVAAQVAHSCPKGITKKRGLETLQDVISCPAVHELSDHATTVNFPQDDKNHAPNIYSLPTVDNFGVFTYKGGLTTPPCTEIVNWNLLDEPMEISEEQLTRLESLILCFVEPKYAKDDPTTVESCKHATVASETGSTSRPPQPLLGRTVIHRCNSGPDGMVVNDMGVLPQTSAAFKKPGRDSENPNIKTSKCTGVLTEDCSNDKRYNPLASPNLKANSDTWYDYEGYWVGTMQVFDNRGQPLKETFASERFEHTLPYPQDYVTMFMNRTIKETRYYETVYYVYKPASPEAFCSFAVPDESFNVLGSGVCGINGYVRVGEKYGTATHEKDGTAAIFYANGRFHGGNTGKVVPVDEDTFYGFVGGNDGASDFEYTETESFTNSERTRISGSGQYIINSALPPYSENPLAESYIYEAVQVSKEAFTQGLLQAYSANYVKASDQKPLISRGYCVDDTNCPTEDAFQQHDPLYTETPYDDDARIKRGWIVYFVIWGALLVLAVMYGWHTHRISLQADRFRHDFACRIASTINFDGTHEKLTAEILHEEFTRLARDKNGVLSKGELKSFMRNKLSERDFEAMFAAIDLDSNGSVDFPEFCAFMSQIGAVYDEEKISSNTSDASSEEDNMKADKSDFRL
ncbi:hypothetical protein ACA910_014033 [Epithemia clementina (nom. ined.)]